MVNGKGPEVCIISLEPVHHKMEKHYTGHFEDCLNNAFGIILMMRTHAQKMKVSVLIGTVYLPFSTCKVLIVCQILFHVYAKIRAKRLKGMFRKNGLSHSC